MNIAIDVGNSSAKTGLFKGHELVSANKFVTNSELIDYVTDCGAESLIISSVGSKSDELLALSKSFTSPIILDYRTPLPITLRYESAETLGVDRIAAVVGAWQKYERANCLVIDMGTAITYDFIDNEANYWGGGITAGVKMKTTALHNYTESLPLIELKDAKIDLIGRSTTDSILSGVINGTAAEVEGIISEYADKYENLRVILTGGDSQYFERRIKAPIFVAQNLVLEGLNAILTYNAQDR